jgi:hypothetical protein
VSPDGSTVFVTGYSGVGTEVDYATVAYDAGTGTPRWVARYNGTGNSIDQPNAIAVSASASQTAEGPARHRLGDRPYARLNARLNASSESYPTRLATEAIVTSVVASKSWAMRIRHSLT